MPLAERLLQKSPDKEETIKRLSDQFNARRKQATMTKFLTTTKKEERKSDSDASMNGY